jgi:hypothetical protein
VRPTSVRHDGPFGPVVQDFRVMADSTASTASTAPDYLFGVREVATQLIERPPALLGVILETLPVVYLVVYGRASAAGVVILSTLALQLITVAGGLKVGLINAPVFTAFAALTCIAAGRPLAAGALALGVALWASIGAASGKGVLIAVPASMLTILIMVPPQVARGTDPHAMRNVGAVLAYTLVASSWGVLIGMITRRGKPFPVIPGAPWRWGLTQGLLVGAVMAVTAAVATSHHLGQGGAWLLMTVFLVFKPLTPTPWKRSLNRALGTMVGVAVVAVYLHTLPTSAPPMALLVPATLLLVAASLTMMAQRWPYWCFVALFTPAIVLLLATMSTTSRTVSVARYLDTLRIEYSLLGIAIALVAQAVLIGLEAVFHLEESSWLGRAARAAPGGS